MSPAPIITYDEPSGVSVGEGPGGTGVGFLSVLSQAAIAATIRSAHTSVERERGARSSAHAEVERALIEI
jgi:hypothetical protein